MRSQSVMLTLSLLSPQHDSRGHIVRQSGNLRDTLHVLESTKTTDLHIPPAHIATGYR